MSEEKGEFDVNAGPAGVGVRTKGYRIMDLVCLASAFGVGYISMTVYSHDADAKDNSKAVVQAVEKNSKDNTEVLRELIKEQKKTRQSMQETACLLDPALRGRNDAREICKRLAAASD